MTPVLPRRAMLGWLAGAALVGEVKAQSGWVPNRLDALNQQLRSHPRIRAFMMEADGAEPFAYFQPGVGASSRTSVASVTKSIVSLLAGIAIERGAFSGADESLASIFPEHAKGAQGAKLARVKLSHVMGMTAGFDPGRTTENSDYFGFVTRLFAPGLLTHALSRKLVRAPGTGTSETTPGERRPPFAAAGFGGQFIVVVPRLKLAVVALAEQESREAGGKIAALIREYALPTVPIASRQ